MNEGDGEYTPLVVALEGHFGKPFTELSVALQQLVAKNFLIPWDILGPGQQREVATQVDYHRDPHRRFEQDWWIKLVARRHEWEIRLREITIAPARDTEALAVRYTSLARIKQEFADLDEDESEVVSAEPTVQRVAMERVLRRWRERDRHAAYPEAVILRLEVAPVIGRQKPEEAPTTVSELSGYSLRVFSPASAVERERSVEDVESPRRCGASVTL
jgi:hypothetical protein